MASVTRPSTKILPVSMFLLAPAMLVLAACSGPGGAMLAPPSPAVVESIPSPEADATPASEAGAASPNPTAAAIVATVQAGGQPVTESTRSPDEQWQVDLILFGCSPTDEGDHAYEALSLGRSDGTGAAVVDSQLIACGGLGAYGFERLFWSPNSRYFYYTPAREGVPDGCGFWQPPIRRLDATTGAVQDMGGGWVSPDGTQIATWLDRALVLWDVDQGELGRLPAADPAHPLVAASWSPDGRAYAYLQAPSPCGPGAAGKSTVVRVEAADLTQSVLLEAESPTFAGLAWEAAGEIRLVDSDGREYILDENGLRLQPEP